MSNLLVVIIKDGLVDKVIGCETSEIQEKTFRSEVIEKSGFEPEECDYEDGYYEYAECCSICITSYS